MWGSVERELHLVFIAGILAVTTVVFVLPVFWKGASWQVPLAFVLLPLPAVIFYFLFHILLR